MVINKQIGTKNAFRNGGKAKPSYTLLENVDMYPSYEN
jgi:hypothetical protein